MPELFATATANVEGNDRLRVPQRDGFVAVRTHYASQEAPREVGIVLPVGCGKSGLITLIPFAVRARRLLAITPYVQLAGQLYQDFNFSDPDRCFYTSKVILPGPEYPDPVPIRGDRTNIADLQEADVVITNIGQLQGSENRWLTRLPDDFFDLIAFDEGHHSVADTYEALKRAFPNARIINFSATPLRADGQLMPGPIIYSYPVRDAIAAGYVKDLRALVLNPATLRYVRREDGGEVEVDLDEVRRLGEDDADFRRSIVTSAETRDTIVDASIYELRRLREETNERRLKIIASALNYRHCIDIVEAYQARGLRAAFIHSREEGSANDRVRGLLTDHQLDVIVQVRMLGEGFDHPFLSVAAVFSIFRSLSPFVQFVGRVMRAIAPNNPGSPLNQGTVIYHAGSNVARRWDDFREFSGADQEYYDQLLPEEEWNFDVGEIRIEPEIPERRGYRRSAVDIRAQDDVTIEEVPLIERDEEALRALRLLGERGYSDEEIRRALQRVRGPRWVQRDAARRALDDRVRHAAGEILNRRRMNHRGRDLDPASDRENFVVVKTAIDRRIMALTDRRPGDRPNYTRDELETIRGQFDEMVVGVERELFNG